MIIGLTGGIGTGKSSAVEYFIKYGAIVIDADKISKNVTDSTSSGLNNINKRYEILTNSSIVITNDENSFSVQLPILNLE